MIMLGAIVGGLAKIFLISKYYSKIEVYLGLAALTNHRVDE